VVMIFPTNGAVPNTGIKCDRWIFKCIYDVYDQII